MFPKESPTRRPTWWGGGKDPVVLDRTNLSFSFATEAPSEEIDRSAMHQLSSYASDLSGYNDNMSPARNPSAQPSDFSFESSPESDYRSTPLASTKNSNARRSDFSPSSPMSDQQRTPRGSGDSGARPWDVFPPAKYTESDTPSPEKVFFVPKPGSGTLPTQANNGEGSTTPYVQKRLARADTEDVQDVALKMYRMLKEHGLAAEAEQAFGKTTDGEHPGATRGLQKGGHEEEEGDGLVGMDYILKDGIVNYLRDVAKLTPPLPQQVVRFHGINYSTYTRPARSAFETFGDKLFNLSFGLIATPFRRKEKPQHLDILKDITGYIMPGSMTLLLGPPGSGKSSLLKVLAGRAETNKTTHLEGTIMFNNREAKDILLTRLIAYVNGQLNQHLPFLTVRETLEFAAECSQGLKPENFTPQMRKYFALALVEGQDPYLEYILQVLGLKNIEDQLVGCLQKGITEDDLNRLTTAEIAMGTYSVMLYDQPCFGQESLATYDLVSTLRAIGRFQQCSAVMSLVQLSPEVFDLFDRVILLGEGEILYQGPRQDVLPYFARLGFKKPSHMDPGDFLMEIAAGEGSQYLESGYGNPSLVHLSMTYRLSDAFKDVLRIVHNQDVVHAVWVESEPNLGLSVRKKERKPAKTKFVEHPGDPPHHRWGSGSLDRSYNSSASSSGDVDVVVTKLSSNRGRPPFGGIESSGTVEVGDFVTGISLPGQDTFYVNVSQSRKDQRSRAAGVASMLAKARGHVRLQVERIRDTESLVEEEAKAADWFSKKYIQTWTKSTITLIKRQITLQRRTQKSVMLLRLFQVLSMGLVTGGLAFRVGGKYDNRKLNAVRGVGFATTVNLLLVSLVQLPLFMMQRPTFYKQRQQRFFRVSSYIVSQSIVWIPQSLIEAIVFSVPVYFLVGLYIGEAGAAFFQYVLLMFVGSCFGSSVVLTLSGLSPLLEQANTLAGLLVSLFLLFSGFIIYPSSMPRYWRWVGSINPVRWANVGYNADQFERLYTDQCDAHLLDVFYCKAYPGKTVGFAYLDHYELRAGQGWYWISIAVIAAWTVFMHLLAYIVYKKIRHTSVTPSLPSQTAKMTDLSSPRSAVSDAGNEAPSGISWAGFVVQGDVDLEEEFVRLGKSPVRPFSRMSMMGPTSTEYDLESHKFSPAETGSFVEEMSWMSCSLPVMPATLTFHNLVLSGKDLRTGEMTKLLHGVSGFAKPGGMLAVMGGKKCCTSTLLKCLANRTEGQLSGEILVNGYKLNSATFSRAQGFVERLDAHQPFLTIRESLMFSAALRLPREVEKDDVWLHVDLILDLLELTAIADHLVGSLHGSTGKTFELAKKITIAVELAANPSILFLDEPTSGLDGLGARNIIHAMQTVAASGRTIITTIQHPSSRMLSAFQCVILLSNEGEQVYLGPVGSNCRHLLGYFETIYKVPQYDMKTNPVTYVFDLLGCGIQTRDPLYDFAEVYRRSSLASANNDELDSLRIENKRKALKLESSGYAASYPKQAIKVITRTRKFLWRNVGYSFSRIVSAAGLGVILGLVFFQIPYERTLDLTSRSLFIYIQVMLIGVVTANNVVPQLGTDRLAYFRERRAGMYAPIFYPVSWALAELPYLLLASLVFVAVGNGLAGIGTDSASNFLRYWLALFVFTVSMTYFAMFVTIATPVPMLASFIVSISCSLWILASGVVVTKPIYNKGSDWMFWGNPFQYVVNTLTAVSHYCDVTRPECLACTLGRPCPACDCTQLKDYAFAFSWVLLKINRAISYERIPRDFAVLSGTALLFAALAFLSFVFFKHNRP